MTQERINDRIRPLEEYDDEGVVRLGRSLKELLEHPGWAAFEEVLRRRDTLFDYGMKHGDHSEKEYARIAGRRVGLQVALQEPHEWINAMEAKLAEGVGDE